MPQGALDNHKPGSPARTWRVLVAEDDLEMRNLLTQALSGAGYQVLEAENGIEVFSYYDEQHGLGNPDQLAGVDLIVSDLRMPWLSGMQLLGELRLREHPIPMILITAFGDEAVHTEAKRLGAVAVLDKPFDIDALLTLVRGVLSPPESVTT